MSIESIDMESSPTMIGALIGAVGGIGSWFFRGLLKTQDEQAKRISALEVSLAKDYVPRPEIDARLDRMQESFESRIDHVQVSVDKVLDHLRCTK